MATLLGDGLNWNGAVSSSDRNKVLAVDVNPTLETVMAMTSSKSLTSNPIVANTTSSDLGKGGR